jgi:hypothetical protein
MKFRSVSDCFRAVFLLLNTVILSPDWALAESGKILVAMRHGYRQLYGHNSGDKKYTL